MIVVMPRVLGQDLLEVPCTVGQQVVEALAPQLVPAHQQAAANRTGLRLVAASPGRLARRDAGRAGPAAAGLPEPEPGPGRQAGAAT
jgi:hypothetical protein